MHFRGNRPERNENPTQHRQVECLSFYVDGPIPCKKSLFPANRSSKMEKDAFQARAQDLSRRSYASLKRLLDSLEFSSLADASETFAIETAVRSLVQSAQEQLQLITDLKMHLTLHDFAGMLEERQGPQGQEARQIAANALQRYFEAVRSGQDFISFDVDSL